MDDRHQPSQVLGIDAGGTYTDVVLVDPAADQVLATAKAPTVYADLSLGIAGAIGALGRDLAGVQRVCLSTTLATNTLVEGLGAGVGLVLLGFDAEAAARQDLLSQIPPCPRAFVPGAMDVHGEVLEPLDEAALRAAVEPWRGQVRSVAVCGVFAIRNPAHEQRAAQVLGEMADWPAVCGHELSGELNAVTRAATAVLNARLLPVVRRLLDAVRPALESHGLPCETPLFLVRGDGTLMTEELARAKPLEVFFSGPASSAIGAGHLAGVDRGVVIDIGGTTSDIVLLDEGAPLLSREGAVVGGVRCHVPGIHGSTLALGGDSHLRPSPGGGFDLGPARVEPVSLATRRFGLDPARITRRITWCLHGLPDFLVLGAPPAGDLPPRERALLDLAESGPISIEQAADALKLTSPTLLPLNRLLGERILLPIGPTPTDVLAAAGEVEHADGEAARHVAEVLCRELRMELGELVQALRQEMAERLIDGVGRTCLERWWPGYHWEGGADLALRHRAAEDAGFLTLKAALRVPVVGVGAPAGAAVPGAADGLAAEHRIPSWAEVGGAVGAAVARVKRVATVTVRPLYEPSGAVRFALYSRRPREVFVDMEDALSRARTIAQELAREEVRGAEWSEGGALEVHLETAEERATDSWGSDLWLGTEVRAIARIAATEE
jgi:N-methylhydantoinase A/oxoprolinase/acetone carboxylase beta subunit